MLTADLITLALARWHGLHGDVSAEDYRAIVAAAREVNGELCAEVECP